MLGREFIPFVLETFGTWGEDAVKFIRMLAENYSDDEDVADVSIAMRLLQVAGGNVWSWWIRVQQTECGTTTTR